MRATDFKYITQCITETFKNETAEYYYTSVLSSGRKCFKGRLYTRYKNQWRKRDKFTKKQKETCETVLKSQDEISQPDNNGNIFFFFFAYFKLKIVILNIMSKIYDLLFCTADGDHEDFEKKKKWLSIIHEPWESVEIEWKNTHIGRRKDILESKDEFDEEWPLLKDSKGYRLVILKTSILYKIIMVNILFVD